MVITAVCCLDLIDANAFKVGLDLNLVRSYNFESLLFFLLYAYEYKKKINQSKKELFDRPDQ